NGFKSVVLPVTVHVGNISAASVSLEIGAATTVITVEGSAVTINTEQATIQCLVTQAHIQNLTLNSRNFLDLEQLEHGDQITYAGSASIAATRRPQEVAIRRRFLTVGNMAPAWEAR